MKQIYKGAFIVAKYNRGQIIIKAYCGEQLIEKQKYFGYKPSEALSNFKETLDKNYFQFNTII
jgi:hypothetical protein